MNKQIENWKGFVESLARVLAEIFPHVGYLL